MIPSSFSNLGLPPIRPQEPFPAYKDSIVRKIEEAICYAWDLLITSGKIDLTTATETDITAELQDCIVDVLNNSYVEGFVPEIFQQPSRDASVKDYTGKWVSKKPDLTFYISSAKPLSSNRGIFFECKPIGSVETYVGYDGLQRFCDGRYAWAMMHAGMIGYVQRKSQPFTAQKAIEEKVLAGAIAVKSQGSDEGAAYHKIWVTEHARNFTLKNGQSPGDISIRHLWLTPCVRIVEMIPFSGISI